MSADPTQPTSEPPGIRPAEVRLAELIGVMTAASGAGLVLAPRLILRILGARLGHGPRDPAPFFVQVVGMFMMTSGGLLVDGSRQTPPARIALRWALAQKTGAALAMVLGVRSTRIGKLALVIAAVDACSAVVAARILMASKE